ncbi:MAG: hypothetical protein PHG05_00395 [Candidatus Nanoarchaeia archaeon]|nr:hypothetical protein [Candidatus Nanoarchaeia archaeon]
MAQWIIIWGIIFLIFVGAIVALVWWMITKDLEEIDPPPDSYTFQTKALTNLSEHLSSLF